MNLNLKKLVVVSGLLASQMITTGWSSQSDAGIVSAETACKIRARGWIAEVYESDDTEDLTIGPIKFENYAGNDGVLKRALVDVSYRQIVTTKSGKKRKITVNQKAGIIVKMTKISCTLGSVGTDDGEE